MKSFIIKKGDKNELDLIKVLWEKLNQLHYELSPYFKNRFSEMTWEKRKEKLLNKSKTLFFEYAVDEKGNNIIAYCISTIDRNDNTTGEIDSIFVDENWRKSGIGNQFIEQHGKKRQPRQKLVDLIFHNTTWLLYPDRDNCSTGS